MPLSWPRSKRHGVTLLELLIVLTLMGIAAAVVAPTVTRRFVAAEPGDLAVIGAAKRLAVRRAEPMRLAVGDSGAWRLTSVATALLVDSGRVAAMDPMTIDIDAVGGCVPARQSVVIIAFDPLRCMTVSRAQQIDSARSVDAVRRDVVSSRVTVQR